MSKLTYRHTIIACFMAYVVQSMVINYVPLLFVQFQNEFSVDLVQITALVSLNFLVQLMADALSIPIIKWIGYRWVAILAHLLAVLGFAAMALLPNMISSNPYIGLVIATAFYSAGGGLIEVVSNPILEEIPTDNNERMMSLMHSFYSWGFVAVTIIAMSYFYFVGIEQWRVLTFFWCIIPLLNMILFIFVPLPTIIEGTAEGGSMMGLLTNQAFWIFSVMMFCAGASEMALSQWLSLYMEKTVGFSKAVGDLAGPLSFAVMMGLFRIYFGLGKHNLSILKFIMISLITLTMSILVMSIFNWPWISLLGSALYGGAVGILWPGTYSLAGKGLTGGPIMFGMLALIGDLGCTVGPGLIGQVAAWSGGNLRVGIFSSIIFPLIFFWMIYLTKKKSLFEGKNEAAVIKE